MAAGARSTYFTSILESLYGLTERVNVGIDAFFKSVRIDEPESPPWQVFKFEKAANTRTALTRIGPKVKIAPIRKWESLSWQSTFFFPLASDLQGERTPQPYLDYDGFVWWNRFFYDKPLNLNWQLFVEADLLGYIDRALRSNRSFIRTPIKGFITYFPVNKISIYATTEWNPSYGLQTMITSHYLQAGLGGKYQLTSSVELELLYTNFLLGKNAGAGQTFNLGFRFLR